jgi:hypothetical protein
VGQVLSVSRASAKLDRPLNGSKWGAALLKGLRGSRWTTDLPALRHCKTPQDAGSASRADVPPVGCRDQIHVTANPRRSFSNGSKHAYTDLAV